MQQLSEDTKKLTAQWLEWDTNKETRDEIQGFIDKGDEKELRAILEKRIAFGTAGLRGQMRAGFANMNDLTILQASQGLCRYLEEKVPNFKQHGVLIGYDGRHHSLEFAECAAAVFISQGVRVHLFSRIVPTPFVSFGTPLLRCAAGIMVTASHNPKEDNGYKVYWATGAQIREPHDKGISNAINANLKPWNIDRAQMLKNTSLRLDPVDAVSYAYFSQIVASCCFNKANNASSELKITYTPMHGVGHEWASKSFEAFSLPAYIPVQEQIKPDPEFPTVAFPNPEEGKGALKLAMETADKHNSPIIIANDPDADRMAIAEKLPGGQWKIFTGNEIGALLAHLWFKRYIAQNPNADKKKLIVINSTVSSKFLQAMAAKEGIRYEETLTGFKWIGSLAEERIRQGYTVLFGFEEAIGFMVSDVCFDKDGIRAAAFFAEAVSEMYSRGETAHGYLESLYKQYGTFRTNNRYFFCNDPVKMQTIFDAIRRGGQYMTHCGPFKIKNIRDLTTGYDNSQPDNKAILPTSTSTQMITFFFENGGVATLRGSGTEPKLKYYIELSGSDGAKVDEELKQMSEQIINTCLEPTKNGLVPPSD